MDEIEVPTDLSALDNEALAALESQLYDATRDAVLRGGELTDADRANALASEAVSAELNRREQIGELSSTLRDQVTADVLEALSALAPVELEDKPKVEANEPEAEAVEPEAVDPTPPSAAELAAADSVPVIEVREGPQVATLRRAAGGRGQGEQLTDSVQLAETLHDVARGMVNGTRGLLVASVDTPSDVQLGNDPDENSRLIDDMIAARVADGAEGLVASGGWITPSEVSYRFFEPESLDGILDLPSVGVNRGGLRVITNGGPTIGDAIGAADAHWVWDEATDANPNGTTKTRYKIPAPSWTDVRLAAYGVALDHGNLASKSFPELTARWLRLAPIAHEHEINRIQLTAIAAASTAVNLTTGFATGGLAATVLDAVSLQGALIRQKYRMAMGTVLEAVFPFWAKEAIRSDLSRQNGQHLLDVSDADIMSWFTLRNIRPQFVYDWLPLIATTKVYEATAATADLTFLLYPVGQWVQGKGSTLDLGLHRDSTLNETNDYTALWTEQFLSIMKMGPESRKVTVTVDVTGYDRVKPAA